MKTNAIFLTLVVILVAFAGGLFYGHTKLDTAVPSQLTLEQVLSIRELHLVKHTYNDLFFLHKKNDKTKAIRAIVQVPVVISACLNLKEIQFVKQHDSIRQIILPRACLNNPQYLVDQMIVRETRSWQWHVGHDLYPEVSSYLQAAIAGRMDSIGHRAVANRILIQAEEEGKEYITRLLTELGRGEIIVRFVDEEWNSRKTTQRKRSVNSTVTQVESIPFGFMMMK
jgi:hypothetical protein